MRETCIALLDNLTQVCGGNLIAHERCNYFQSKIRIGELTPRGDLLGAEARQFSRHIQSSVRRESGKKHFFEGLLWAATARTLISHFAFLSERFLQR